MDANGKRATTWAVRAAAVTLAVLLMLMVAALAAPERADAHQQPGRTQIYVDGNIVKNTRDDHFAYRQSLSPGCHSVRVEQRQGGGVSVARQHECSGGRSVLTVEVDHNDVSISTSAKSISYEDDMAR